MARITPRSVNIREIERASLNIDHCSEHCLMVLTSYANGIEDYTKADLEPPSVYYDHGAKLTAIMDGLASIKLLLDDILKEL